MNVTFVTYDLQQCPLCWSIPHQMKLIAKKSRKPKRHQIGSKRKENLLNSISAQLSSLVHHFLSGGGPSENDEISIDEEENEQMEEEDTSAY